MYPKIFQNQFFAKPSARLVSTRRSFILGAVATTAGLAIGYRMTGTARAEDTPAAAPVHPFQPYIVIAPDGAVTITSSQFEMGQGSYFGIATLVNEELGADWA